MKKLNFIKALFCLFLVFTLSISTASASMFGTTCGYSIGPDSNGDCRINIKHTSYFFWIPSNSEFSVSCDSGWTVSDLCGDTTPTAL